MAAELRGGGVSHGGFHKNAVKAVLLKLPVYVFLIAAGIGGVQKGNAVLLHNIVDSIAGAVMPGAECRDGAAAGLKAVAAANLMIRKVIALPGKGQVSGRIDGLLHKGGAVKLQAWQGRNAGRAVFGRKLGLCKLLKLLRIISFP